MLLRAFTLSLLLSACAGSKAECPAPTTPVQPAEPAVRDAKGVVGFWIKFKPLPGKEAEAYAVVNDAIEQWKKTEPGDLAYIAFKNEAGEIVFFEVYENEAAHQAHSGSAFFKETFAKFAPLVDMSTMRAEPTTEVINGFIR